MSKKNDNSALINRRQFLSSTLVAGATLALYEPIWANDASVPDTLFVTWFDDPTTTMAIQWLEKVEGRKAPMSTELEYQVDLDTVSARVVLSSHVKQMSGSKKLYVHRFELAGLQPDTAYRFRAKGSDSWLKFRTAPAKMTKPITFIEGGDSIGNGMLSLHQHAAKWDPLFAINGGDIAFCNGRDATKWVGYLQAWHRYMVTPDGFCIPMLTCLGNHECNGAFNQPRSRCKYYFSLFDGFYQTTGYNVLDFGDYLSIVLLDSEVTTPVAGKQTQWLDQTLATRKNFKHLFVVYHVPAYPSHRPENNKQSVAVNQHWVPILDKHRIKLVFEHHDHTFKRTYKLRAGKQHYQGVTYLGDGAWGRGPRAVNNTDFMLKTKVSLCLNRVTLNDDKVDVLVINEKNKELDRFRL